MVIKLNYDHIFSIWMGCGMGTNTREKLLSLWALLKFAINVGIVSFQVMGDSKVIIDWAS